jgi:hypothetical protein
LGFDQLVQRYYATFRHGPGEHRDQCIAKRPIEVKDGDLLISLQALQDQSLGVFRVAEGRIENGGCRVPGGSADRYGRGLAGSIPAGSFRCISLNSVAGLSAFMMIPGTCEM